MTLLTTEIHLSPTAAYVVFAADQCVLRNGCSQPGQQKVFRIDAIRAGIGFFGLAEIPAALGTQRMDEFLRDFVGGISSRNSLNDVAQTLAKELNRLVPSEWILSERSGFHLAGFAADGIPEFWYIRNVDDQGQPTVGRYEPREEFRRAGHHSRRRTTVIGYRNGDLRAHIVAWKAIDDSLGRLLGHEEFRPVNSADGYREWVKFKMELVASFYARFSRVPLVAPPIDVFVLER